MDVKIDFSQHIKDLFFVGEEYKGEVGLEIEVEGENLPKVIPSYWKGVVDGSLRGEAIEYVLKQPCARNSVSRFLNYLEVYLKKNGAVLHMSNRTSVHVHINMAKYTLTECFTFVVLYLLFEDLLTNIAGESRVGNLFCLRAKDAEYFVDSLVSFAKTRKFNPKPEALRYTSVNVCSIVKFNSVEFRALRGTTDPQIITEWVNLLLTIKDASIKFDNPNSIIAEFSQLGPEKFVKKIFPDHWNLFTHQVNYQQTMWDSTRLIQEIVYATDWTKEIKPKRMFKVQDDGEKKIDPGELLNLGNGLNRFEWQVGNHQEEDERFL